MRDAVMSMENISVVMQDSFKSLYVYGCADVTQPRIACQLGTLSL